MGIDVIRDQEAGELMLEDKNDDETLKHANENDFDDNDYALLISMYFYFKNKGG